MLTGEIKNKIDGIWTMLWTEGSTNPLTNIEQITYLLFMKSLDEEEMIKENDAKLTGDVYESIFPADKEYYRWHIFKDLGDNEDLYKKMTQEIFPFIKTLGTQEDQLTTETAFSKYMKDALFQINQPATLKRVITAIEELDLTNRDTSGDVYEHLLSKLATSGTNGQFRTPRHIIKMMVELMQPTLADTISDPAMGSAGFLVAASEYIRQNQSDGFFVSEL
ncbi:MAG: type I restriction-modification system subunit M, partial [Vagococcus salmoninarum]|uniref:type I restriction-modification system subunit M n=1 Tax=Vagococcus salmoninarum TaxID=2739 RepID=UPI003F95D6FF